MFEPLEVIIVRSDADQARLDALDRAGKLAVDDDWQDEEELRDLGGPSSGNFGHAGRPGKVGGSADEDLVVVKKAKAPPATKDQIAMAVSMKASGSSYAAIEKETGLNPKQAATIVFKHKKAAANIAQVLNGPAFKTKVPPKTPSADPLVPLNPAPTLTQFEQITAQGYEWKAKTSGPNKGKFAFFQNGVQVSKFADKADWASVVSTMHHGKGPGYKAPPPPPEPGKIGGLVADHEGMYDAPLTPWPISDSVVRARGSASYQQVREIGKKWTSSIPLDQREALHSYTGTGSTKINARLREGGTLSPVAKRIDAALNAAPLPPPPQLVWRGVPGVSMSNLVASLNTGDVIKLKGFQSTSVNPDKGLSWSSGQTFFEIKPKKGGFVGTISQHSHEDEFLLPHGAKYLVRGTKTVPIGSGSQKRLLIQLEML